MPACIWRAWPLSLFVLFVLVALASAQTENPPAALPGQFEKEFARGLDAAKQNNFELALRYFAKVQEDAPDAAPVLFNLGLAHAKVGHELQAIAWFHAYLAQNPQSEQKEQVLSRIEALKAAARGKIGKMLEELKKVSDTIRPKDKGDFLMNEARTSAFRGVAAVEAAGGDMEAAKKTLAQISPGYTAEEKFFAARASRTSALVGDIAKAQDAGGQADAVAWSIIAKQLLDAGNLNGAWNAARKMKAAPYDVMPVLVPIVRRALDDGDLIPAEEALKAYGEGSWPIAKLVAERKTALGDVAGAMAVLSSTQNTYQQAEIAVAIATEQWKRGDWQAAKETAQRVIDMKNRGTVFYEEHYPLAIALGGDPWRAFEEAQKVPLNAFQPNIRAHVFSRIVYLLAHAGKNQDAEKMIQKARGHKEGMHQDILPSVYFATALREKGKFQEALEVVQRVQETDTGFRNKVLSQIAQDLLKTGDLDGAKATLARIATKPELQTGEEMQVWMDVASALRAKGRTPEGLSLCKKAYQWTCQAIQNYALLERVRAAEKILRKQIQLQGVGGETAQWLAFSRLMSDIFDMEKALQEANKEYTQPTPGQMVVSTAQVAQTMRDILFKIERMEKGNFDGTLAHIFAKELDTR